MSGEGEGMRFVRGERRDWELKSFFEKKISDFFFFFFAGTYLLCRCLMPCSCLLIVPFTFYPKEGEEEEKRTESPTKN